MADKRYRLLGLVCAMTLVLSGCGTLFKHKAAAATGTAKESTASTPSQPPSGQASTGTSGQPEAAAAPAEQGTKPEAKPSPQPAAPAPNVPATDLASLIEKMKTFPRVLWHSHDDTYQFYVGTVLFAKYDPYKDIFTIRTDNADLKNLVCEHDPDKGWKVAGSSKGVTCKGLLNEMDDYLSHPYS